MTSDAVFVEKQLDACVLCGSQRMRLCVPLKPIPIATPNFQMPKDEALAKRALAGVPLDLFQCDSCGHVQVGTIGNPELQYRDYIYTTSLSLGLSEHFREYARQVAEKWHLGSDELVLEIGSNDGTLLSFFKERGAKVVGVDPARRIAEDATARGIPTHAEFFGEALGAEIAAASGRAKVIIANNMIANVPAMMDYARGIKAALAPDGVFVFETQYGPDVIERTLLDTVYNEHISYFLIKPTVAFFAAHGLKVVDAERIATKGGSIRVSVMHDDSSVHSSAAVSEMVAYEDAKGMFAQPFFDQLNMALAAIRAELTTLVDGARSRGRFVAGFGVSVGTTALLPQFDLIGKLDFLLDDDPNKGEALSGPDYHIPILPGSALMERNPEFVVIFAWRYAEPIMKNHPEYQRSGGTWIVPLPQVSRIGDAR